MPLWIKPAGIPRVNPHHPLAKDLILCVVPEWGDLLTGTPPTPTDSNGTIAAGELGFATKHSQAGGNSTGGVRYDLPSWAPLYGIGANWSAFTVAAITSIGSNYRALVGVPFQSNGDNPYYGWSPFNAYADTSQGVWVTVGGSLSYYNGLSAWFTQDGAPHNYYVESVNGTLTMDRDGVQYATGGTVSAGAPQITTNKQPLYLGCTTSLQLTPQAFASTVYLVFAFNRTLSATERVAIAQDPLALLDYGEDLGNGTWFAPLSGTSYTLTATTGSVAVTGQSAALRVGRRLPAAQGSIAVTGQAASLRFGPRLLAAQGSIAVTGQAASLREAHRLPAAQGAVAVTGQSAALRMGYRLVATAGSVAVSAQSASLRVGYKLPAAQGTVAVTGQSATLLYSAGRTLTATTGTVTVTAQSANLKVGRRLPCSAGSVAVTGQSAALKAGRVLGCAAASVALTGQSAALRAGRRLGCSAGSVAVTGQAANLVYRQSTNYVLVATRGLVSITGQAANLVYGSAARDPSVASITITDDALYTAEMGLTDDALYTVEIEVS